MSIISCAPHDTIAEARALMEKNHIRHLPIIDKQNVIGIVSIRDLLLAEACCSDRPDVAAEHRAQCAPAGH